MFYFNVCDSGVTKHRSTLIFRQSLRFFFVSENQKKLKNSNVFIV